MGRTRKRVFAKVKIELEAGGAGVAPPVGWDLGPLGINLAEFVRRYNDATRDQDGALVPAVVTVYEDRSFDLVTKPRRWPTCGAGLRGWRRAPAHQAEMA